MQRPGKMPGRRTGPHFGRIRPVANSQAYATLKRRMRRQILFNPLDQLGNTDRRRKEWMPLNAEASLCLSFRDERSEKDDRRSVQFRVALDSGCYFASVRLWHHDIEQD